MATKGGAIPPGGARLSGKKAAFKSYLARNRSEDDGASTRSNRSTKTGASAEPKTAAKSYLARSRSEDDASTNRSTNTGVSAEPKTAVESKTTAKEVIATKPALTSRRDRTSRGGAGGKRDKLVQKFKNKKGPLFAHINSVTSGSEQGSVGGGSVGGGSVGAYGNDSLDSSLRSVDSEASGKEQLKRAFGARDTKLQKFRGVPLPFANPVPKAHSTDALDPPLKRVDSWRSQDSHSRKREKIRRFKMAKGSLFQARTSSPSVEQQSIEVTVKPSVSMLSTESDDREIAVKPSTSMLSTESDDREVTVKPSTSMLSTESDDREVAVSTSMKSLESDENEITAIGSSVASAISGSFDIVNSASSNLQDSGLASKSSETLDRSPEKRRSPEKGGGKNTIMEESGSASLDNARVQDEAKTRDSDVRLTVADDSVKASEQHEPSPVDISDETTDEAVEAILQQQLEQIDSSDDEDEDEFFPGLQDESNFADESFLRDMQVEGNIPVESFPEDLQDESNVADVSFETADESVEVDVADVSFETADESVEVELDARDNLHDISCLTTGTDGSLPFDARQTDSGLHGDLPESNFEVSADNDNFETPVDEMKDAAQRESSFAAEQDNFEALTDIVSNQTVQESALVEVLQRKVAETPGFYAMGDAIQQQRSYSFEETTNFTKRAAKITKEQPERGGEVGDEPDAAPSALGTEDAHADEEALDSKKIERVAVLGSEESILIANQPALKAGGDEELKKGVSVDETSRDGDQVAKEGVPGKTTTGQSARAAMKEKLPRIDTQLVNANQDEFMGVVGTPPPPPPPKKRRSKRQRAKKEDVASAMTPRSSNKETPEKADSRPTQKAVKAIPRSPKSTVSPRRSPKSTGSPRRSPKSSVREISPTGGTAAKGVKSISKAVEKEDKKAAASPPPPPSYKLLSKLVKKRRKKRKAAAEAKKNSQGGDGDRSFESDASNMSPPTDTADSFEAEANGSELEQSQLSVEGSSTQSAGEQEGGRMKIKHEGNSGDAQPDAAEKENIKKLSDAEIDSATEKKLAVGATAKRSKDDKPFDEASSTSGADVLLMQKAAADVLKAQLSPASDTSSNRRSDDMDIPMISRKPSSKSEVTTIPDCAPTSPQNSILALNEDADAADKTVSKSSSAKSEVIEEPCTTPVSPQNTTVDLSEDANKTSRESSRSLSPQNLTSELKNDSEVTEKTLLEKLIEKENASVEDIIRGPLAQAKFALGLGGQSTETLSVASSADGSMEAVVQDEQAPIMGPGIPEVVVQAEQASIVGPGVPEVVVQEEQATSGGPEVVVLEEQAPSGGPEVVVLEEQAPIVGPDVPSAEDEVPRSRELCVEDLLGEQSAASASDGVVEKILSNQDDTNVSSEGALVQTEDGQQSPASDDDFVRFDDCEQTAGANATEEARSGWDTRMILENPPENSPNAVPDIDSSWDATRMVFDSDVKESKQESEQSDSLSWAKTVSDFSDTTESALKKNGKLDRLLQDALAEPGNPELAVSENVSADQQGPIVEEGWPSIDEIKVEEVERVPTPPKEDEALLGDDDGRSDVDGPACDVLQQPSQEERIESYKNVSVDYVSSSDESGGGEQSQEESDDEEEEVAYQSHNVEIVSDDEDDTKGGQRFLSDSFDRALGSGSGLDGVDISPSDSQFGTPTHENFATFSAADVAANNAETESLILLSKVDVSKKPTDIPAGVSGSVSLKDTKDQHVEATSRTIRSTPVALEGIAPAGTPSNGSSDKTSPKSTKAPSIPLIAPPSQEKIRKWEESKLRPYMSIERSQQKKKEVETPPPKMGPLLGTMESPDMGTFKIASERSQQKKNEVETPQSKMGPLLGTIESPDVGTFKTASERSQQKKNEMETPQSKMGPLLGTMESPDVGTFRIAGTKKTPLVDDKMAERAALASVAAARTFDEILHSDKSEPNEPEQPNEGKSNDVHSNFASMLFCGGPETLASFNQACTPNARASNLTEVGRKQGAQTDSSRAFGRWSHLSEEQPNYVTSLVDIASPRIADDDKETDPPDSPINERVMISAEALAIWLRCLVLQSDVEEKKTDDAEMELRLLLQDDTNFDILCALVASKVSATVTSESTNENGEASPYGKVKEVVPFSLASSTQRSDVLAANFVSFVQRIGKLTSVETPFKNANPFVLLIVGDSMVGKTEGGYEGSMQKLVFENKGSGAVQLTRFFYQAVQSATRIAVRIAMARFAPKSNPVDSPAKLYQEKDTKAPWGMRYTTPPVASPSPFETTTWALPSAVVILLGFLGDPVAVCRMKMVNRFCNRIIAENEHMVMRDAVRLGGMSMNVRPAFWMWVTLEKFCEAPEQRSLADMLGPEHPNELSKLAEEGRTGKWHGVIERDVARAFGNFPPHKTGARLRADSIVRALVTYGRGRLIKRGVKGGGEIPPIPSIASMDDGSRRKTKPRVSTAPPPWELGDEDSEGSETPTDTVSDWGGVSPVASFAESLGEDAETKRLASRKEVVVIQEQEIEQESVDASSDTVEDLALNGNALTNEMKTKLQSQLELILHALAAQHDDVGYCQGMDYVVAHLLRVLQDTVKWHAVRGCLPAAILGSQKLAKPRPDGSSEVSDEDIDKSLVVEEAIFRVVDCLFTTYNLRHMYWPELRNLKICCRVFERLIKHKLPVLADHFEHHELNVGLFALGWFQTLFLYLPSMPTATVCHMWDIWLVERSLKIFFRVGTAILFLSQPILLNHDLEGMMTYLNTFPDATLLKSDILIACALQIKVTNRMLTELETEVTGGI